MASKYTDMISKLRARNQADQAKFAAQNTANAGSSFAGTPNVNTNQQIAANNSYDAYFAPNQAINSYLDKYLPGMSQELNNSNQLNLDVFRDMENQLNQQRERVMGQYGPEGDMTNRMRSFYSDVYGNVNNEFANAQKSLDDARALNTSVYQGNVANMDTSAEVSGASGAQRAASKAKADQELAANQLANSQASGDLGLRRLETELGLRQQEMQDYNNLYQTLNNYLDQYVQNYGNTRDKYLINNYNNMLNVKSQLQQYLQQLELQNKALATDLASSQAAAGQPVTAANPAFKPVTPQTPTYETGVTVPYNNQLNSGVSQGFVYPGTRPDIPLNKDVIQFKPTEIKNPYNSPFTRGLKPYGL